MIVVKKRTEVHRDPPKACSQCDAAVGDEFYVGRPRDGSPRHLCGRCFAHGHDEWMTHYVLVLAAGALIYVRADVVDRSDARVLA